MSVILTLSVAGAIAIYFNKKIEETYALAMMLISLVLYIFALLGFLSVGVIVSLGVCMLATVYCAFYLFHDRARIKNAVITWGMLAIILYLFFFLLYCMGRGFTHPDEYYCWGLMIKEYYYTGELFSSARTSFSEGYPFYIQLWDYLATKTWITYSESMCFFAHDMFKIALLVPCFSYIEQNKSVSRFFMLMIVLPMICVLSGVEGFEYLLFDGLQGAIICCFFYMMMLFLEKKEEFYYVASCMALVVLSLCKRSGTIFASIVILAAFVILLKAEKKYIYRLIGYFIVTVAAALSFYKFSIYTYIPIIMFVGSCILWVVNYIYCRMTIRIRYFFCLIGLPCIALAGYMIALRVAGADSFFEKLFARFFKDLFWIKFENNYVLLPYGIYMTLALAFALYYRQYNAKRKSDLMFGLVLSMVVYGAVAVISHIYTIAPSNLETANTSVIARYMVPFEIVVVYILTCEYLFKKEQKNYVSIIALLIVMLISNAGGFLESTILKYKGQQYRSFANAGVELQSGEWVYYIDEVPERWCDDREFYYWAYPAKTNFAKNNLLFGAIGRLEMDEDELKEELLDGYDYVFIKSIDYDFADRYANLFENKDEIAPGNAYRVLSDDDNVSLEFLKPVS